MPSELADLTAYADALERLACGSDWLPYYNLHGDPYVVHDGHQGREMFHVVATVATSPDDYGRDNARLAAAAPAASRALAAVLRAIHDTHPVKPHPENASWLPVCGGCSTGQVSHSDDGSYTHKVLASKCPTRLAVAAAVSPLVPLLTLLHDRS